MPVDKLVVVKRKTTLEELLRRHATTSQARFYVESRGQSYDFYSQQHEHYQRGLEQVMRALPGALRKQVIEKEELPTYQFAANDLVVVVGDDGLLVNTAKYIRGLSVISVNADPQNFDGVLASCTIDTFSDLLKKTFEGKVDGEALTMAEAQMEDGQSLYALNDFFIGKSGHSSARYTLEYDGKEERQSSSGIIVSTGTGSTGWLTSVMMGAHGLATEEAFSPETVAFPRDADYLKFVVREPFPSRITGTGVIYGDVTTKRHLKIASNMAESGVIFGDGIESDYLEFNAGRSVVIKPADQKVYLIHSK